MSKITKFVDMMMNFPNRFRVDGIQKTIVEDWGITQQGTKNKAEYFNELEKQITFDCLTNRIIDGSKEVYEMDLEGYPEFGEYELKFRAFFQTTNTTTNCYARFYAIGGGSFIEYPIRFYKGNVLTAPSIGTLAQKKFINFKILEIGGIKYAVIDFPVLDITSTTDGLTVANGKDLTLNVIDNLTTPSSTKPLSANMGKYLGDNKFSNTGIALPIEADMNTILTKGHYTAIGLGRVTTGTGMKNAPFGLSEAFTMVVDGLKDGITDGTPPETYLVQTATSETGKVKSRNTHDAGVNWTPWVADLTENSPPVPVGGILVMGDNTNPADKYSGTTWTIIADDKVLRGGNQSTVNATGGSNTKTIAVENLPAHTFTRGTMEIAGSLGPIVNYSSGVTGAFYKGASSPYKNGEGTSEGHVDIGFQASRAWTGASSSVGSGAGLDILPAYQKLVIWKRNS